MKIILLFFLFLLLLTAFSGKLFSHPSIVIVRLIALFIRWKIWDEHEHMREGELVRDDCVYTERIERATVCVYLFAYNDANGIFFFYCTDTPFEISVCGLLHFIVKLHPWLFFSCSSHSIFLCSFNSPSVLIEIGSLLENYLVWFLLIFLWYPSKIVIKKVEKKNETKVNKFFD